MMDDDSLMDVSLTDLDLNQEPIDPPLDGVMRFGSLLNDLESTHGRIDERIRQLEAVTVRARQRQRWRQARSIEIGHYSSQIVGVGNDRATLDGNNSVAMVERTPERGKGCKRDSSHLVAKALGMDSEIKKVEKEGGSFYDCNICLDLANDPVLTCCGHLFCWACFYQVSYIDSCSKECPVCKGEVSDNTVIPIYGNGNSERVNELESGLKIPPRPKARRVESVRQQRVNQGLSHVPVAEALRRIRMSIGAIGDQAPEQESRTGISAEGQNVDGRRIRIHQVSRVLSESAASLSSLSSALSSAERLVEDLENVINNRLRSDGSAPQTNNQPLDTAAVAEASEVTGSVLRDRTMRSSREISLPVAPSASFTQRRRSNVSRTPDVDNRDTRESRRRRLN